MRASALSSRLCGVTAVNGFNGTVNFNVTGLFQGSRIGFIPDIRNRLRHIGLQHSDPKAAHYPNRHLHLDRHRHKRQSVPLPASDNPNDIKTCRVAIYSAARFSRFEVNFLPEVFSQPDKISAEKTREIFSALPAPHRQLDRIKFVQSSLWYGQ